MQAFPPVFEAFSLTAVVVTRVRDRELPADDCVRFAETILFRFGAYRAESRRSSTGASLLPKSALRDPLSPTNSFNKLRAMFGLPASAAQAILWL